MVKLKWHVDGALVATSWVRCHACAQLWSLSVQDMPAEYSFDDLEDLIEYRLSDVCCDAGPTLPNEKAFHFPRRMRLYFSKRDHTLPAPYKYKLDCRKCNEASQSTMVMYHFCVR